MPIIRRFSFDPGDEVLVDIESVNILDQAPASAIVGVGTGTALLVAEMEDGPFGEPTEVTGPDDLKKTFGSFGFAYGGTVGNNPCARARKADGAVLAEYWNGNGVVQLTGKAFARFVVCRVDTSVGSVMFTRLAALSGLAKPSYNLQTGQILAMDIGAGSLSATFTGVAATVTGVSGTFAIVGGEQAVLGADQRPNFTVTFLSTDTTVAACAARINQYAGFPFAAVVSGQLKLTGLQAGTGGSVRVVSFDAGGTGTKLGLTVATTTGTGNVADISQVTFAELKSVAQAAMTGVKFDQLADGSPRASNAATPATGTLTVANTTTALDFGFAVGASSTAATGTAGTVPAGTVVQTSGGLKFVIMQTINVAAANAGPYSAKVRHALDDGTGAGAAAGQLTVVGPELPISIGAFAVNNLVPVTAALSESAIDAAYLDAFDATLDVNTVAREINVSWSARQSNVVRRKVVDNAKVASANGCFGRYACVRPPMGLTKQIAQGVAEPGVGPYRSDTMSYCYPQGRTFVPQIAQVGVAGGAGFTSDGFVDVGADGFYASCCSQLPPEENPGQDAGLLGNVVSVESSPNAKGFTTTDYKNFKRNGIAALRFDRGTATFQSGVTSVDPQQFPNLKNTSRRRMAYFLQDSMSTSIAAFVKKLNTVRRRTAVKTEVRQFLASMKSEDNLANQRIDDFSTDDSAKAGNTPERRKKGIYRLKVKVTTLTSMDAIVLDTEIGETVSVTETAA